MGLAKLGFFSGSCHSCCLRAARSRQSGRGKWGRDDSRQEQDLSAHSSPIQSKNPELLGVGKILVASRNLGDPNFAQTVICWFNMMPAVWSD